MKEQEALEGRGKLTIFFGAAPGVGKTYAMLEAARSERDLRRDVVVGVVETHGRYDTAALLLGLELLPRQKFAHGAVVFEDFDVDAALRRRPGLILVDELAHANAPGSRHAKRWQDVQELLDAGIDVYASINVQHIESLNDVVAQITGVVVRETIPDGIFDNAHDVRLIDLLPDELLERLEDGKVYLKEQAARASDNFFRKGNLIALRELALRRTAERVDAQMASYKRDHGIDATWAVYDRVLVSVSSSPSSVHLVRAAKRMASSLRAPWIAAYVETPASVRSPATATARANQTLRLAEDLGAESVTLSGPEAAKAIVGYARSQNVTKIVVGKPTHPRWRDVVSRSFLDEVVRQSGDIDVYVISGDSGVAAPRAAPRRAPSYGLSSFVGAGAVVAVATAAAGAAFGRKDNSEVVMVYLLGIVLVSLRFGYAPSIAAALLSITCFDFFFIPPYYSFAVSDARHLVTFVVMFVVAIVISSLNRRVQDQALAARGREQRTAALYALSRELANTRSLEALLAVALRHIDATFESRSVISLPDVAGTLSGGVGAEGPVKLEPKEEGVAEWVWLNQRPAGNGTDTLPSAAALHHPLTASRGRVGVLSVTASLPRRFHDPEQMHLLQAFANQIGSTIERALFAEEKRAAQEEVRTEQLRNTLLSSFSHDLRTPLALITGAASALVDDHALLGAGARVELATTVYDGVSRLNRIVRNLLDMTRVASGALQVNKEWLAIEEIVGAALHRLEDRLVGRPVTITIPADLAVVAFDGVLIEQVLINLLENAIKYTPPESPIELAASQGEAKITVEVVDHGPGVPHDEAERVFDKFHRVTGGASTDGIGLGLTISRAIVAAHGGKLWVDPGSDGGAVFRFTLPIEGTPPDLPQEEREGAAE